MTDKKARASWLGFPIAERLRYMKNEMHISHPDFVRAATEIKRGVETCRATNSGMGLLVLAPTGAGKTYLRHYLARQWTASKRSDRTMVPVISFKIPTKPNTRSMGRELLRSMGDAAWNFGTAQELDIRIRHLIPQVGTVVILIDDVHDIPARRREGGIKDIGDWLRSLIEDCGVLVVLLGIPSAAQIVSLNPQLKRRASAQIRIDYFQLDTNEHRRRLSSFLARVCENLPLAHKSTFDDNLVESIFYATYGIPGQIFSLLLEAVNCAVADGRERIERCHLLDAFKLRYQDSAATCPNPFSVDWTPRPLDRPGEIFYGSWIDTWHPGPVNSANREVR